MLNHFITGELYWCTHTALSFQKTDGFKDLQQILQFRVHLSETLKSTSPYKQTLSAKRHVQLVTGLFYCCQAGIANAMRKLQVSLGTQRHRRRHVASNKIKPYQRIGLFKIQINCRVSPWAHIGSSSCSLKVLQKYPGLFSASLCSLQELNRD